jgi:hypothetical protein
MKPDKKIGSIWGWGLVLALVVNLLIWVPMAQA